MPHFSNLFLLIINQSITAAPVRGNQPISADQPGADKCLYGSDGLFGYPAEDDKYDHVPKSLERKMPLARA